ncbi:hypothetical protein METBIDRAFT_9078 [Metschnikowia bicuspidata var. bicuspidata NRRL YB-4993]|uniref:Uncharacterized protein n=1 Tax=Metschnikowia bicuspidata var. bicuspidata NRRL YB-4993 TaxID=869754 RepID=A0A1A0HFC9_9ASCO|nr:hypothetical protein METBIDRAFT_9078 [Metschnikowia bicuspidata var. bicuspidata NRRL YB-4993]OBA22706.1 hypothetical protein METBIDRAFT_9078 [Metschnikowia bicuspidata var. bicuspidata NRRL YB-4993]
MPAAVFAAQARPAPGAAVVLFGRPVLQRLAEKAPPFVLGMLATYVLQLAVPTVAYYTAATARLLKAAFLWLALLVAVAWLAGLGPVQAHDLAGMARRVAANFQHGPVAPGPQNRPGRSYRRASALVPEPRSPERGAGPGRKTPCSPSRQRPKAGPCAPGPVHVPSFVVPVRDSLHKACSDAVFPHQPVILRPVILRPGARRHGSDSEGVRDEAHPKDNRATGQLLLPAARDTGLALPATGMGGVSGRRLAYPQEPPRPSSHVFLRDNGGVSFETRPDSAGSLETRRGSAGSFETRLDSPGSPRTRRNSAGSPKTRLDSAGTAAVSSVPGLPADGALVHGQKSGPGNAGFLGRTMSVLSEQSVLGTRANYSKFLANVGK